MGAVKLDRPHHYFPNPPNQSRVLTCQTITGSDMKAFNTFDEPNKVAPQILDAPASSTRMIFKLPAGSYSIAQAALS